MTCGTQAVEIETLVRAILAGDLIAAREWIADARRCDFSWHSVGQPVGLNEDELVVAAGLLELLAQRDGLSAPAWTAGVQAASELIILDPGLERMRRTFERARTEGPEPLRRRNIVAPSDFLKIA